MCTCSLMALADFISDFGTFNDRDCCEKEEFNKDKLIVFIGDSKYPARKGGYPSNPAPFGVYRTYNFNEVAFLSDIKTIELFSIVGILFGNIDIAANVVNFILKNSLMDKFAKYLFYKKKVMLVNADGKIGEINKLLKNYTNHQVCFCCGQYSNKYKISQFTKLDMGKTNKKYNSFIKLIHPSSKSYRRGYQNACSCYWDHTYIDKSSNLTIQDFKVF